MSAPSEVTVELHTPSKSKLAGSSTLRRAKYIFLSGISALKGMTSMPAISPSLTKKERNSLGKWQ